MSEPLLSVVVPVYNQAGAIGDNVSTIHERIAAGLQAPFELIVVSDGSLDGTEEEVLERRLPLTRVLHYERNLGKGYALRVGALAARGEWVAFVDADLDLDPAAIPRYLAHARSQRLDYAIGSKRHPDSRVEYPRSRRVASWLYQRLVRLLFRLDVRDTQVGLKVFRRELLDDVVPLLLVKRFAFDLELLAVARALGYERGEELPVDLDYRFSGSGVRSIAVLRALVDTLAIAYRLRVLRYYQRRRAVLPQRAAGVQPPVSLVAVEGQEVPRQDYPALELVSVPSYSATERVDAARRAAGDLVAFLEPGAVPAANWVAACAALLVGTRTGAVVVPALAPSRGPLLHRSAAAVRESRLGGGSRYFRFTPGNIRVVRDFPAATVVIHRELYLRVAPVGGDELCAAVTGTGSRVVYTPDTVVVVPPPALFRPHLAQAWADGRRGAELRPTTIAAVAVVSLLVLGWPLLLADGWARDAWLAAWAAYIVAVAAAAAVGALRFRSATVGLLAVPALVATHLVYAAAVVARLVQR